MTIKTHVLVQTHDNWADEMDIYGYQILTVKQYQERLVELQQEFEENDGSYVWYIGTNEEIEYDCFDNFLETLTVSELTTEEAKFLKDILGSNGNGHNLI